MSKEISGRHIEKEKFNESLNSHRSELIAIYGRRRIGKTYLIREYFSKNMLFSFSGLRDGVKQNQIENFMIELKAISNKFQDSKPENWLQAFDLLKQYLKGIKETKKKKVIFIDEFPWIDTMRSNFLPAFENFWNTYCTTRNDLIVIVYGSAASYMLKKIIKNRGGLHNRITRKIKLQPFTLSEVKEFFTNKKIILPEIEIVKIYMTFGGVAEYLEHIQPGDSAVTAIERICFQKGAQLEYEFDEVFKSLFDEGTYHEQIIQALCRGAKMGMTRDEILKDKKITSGGQFSTSLVELIESGFIEKYEAIGNNRKITRYRIFDEFCLFHLQFIAKNKSNQWTQLHTTNEYKVWCGYAFEMICYKHIGSIKKTLKCDQILSKNYSWSNKNAQIDLVIDRNDNTILLCELKFYNDVFTIDMDYACKLRNKESQFKEETKTKKGVYTVMISPWGTTGKHGIGLVTKDLHLDSLFM